MNRHEELLRDIHAWANGDTEAQQTFRRVWSDRLADALPPTCEAAGCCEPATEEIYEKRVCRKHLTLWSA